MKCCFDAVQVMQCRLKPSILGLSPCEPKDAVVGAQCDRGGFAIGGAFQSSGLSTEVGTWMASWNTLPFPLLVMAISSVTTFLTEVTSNTASMHLLMPVLSSAAIQGGISPILMMLPAVLSVSCAFMLPVATAPNAIVFATGKIPIRFMIRCGFVLNVIGVLIVLVVSLTLGMLGWLPGASGSG